MEDVRVLEIKQSVFANNDAHADGLRERLRAQGTFLLNLMSSPGSGKTTGGMCHLDAYMTEQGLDALLDENSDHVDLAILENVGNLVCPAEFDTGACANAMILSVPEGDDKPLKYPLMFSICDVVLINKIDALPIFDTFSMERARENILMRNPNATIIPICAKTGEGIDQWAQWLRDRVAAWKAGA